MDTETASNLIEATSLQRQTVFTLEMPPMNDYYTLRWICSLDSRFDPGSFPRQGYQHRHRFVGDRFPKALRKKPRNRKGRFAE